MTRFRSVRPNLAWDARSPSPMYASTSTIRPMRRSIGTSVAPSSDGSGSRMSHVPRSAFAAASVGPATTARSRTARTSGGLAGEEGLDRCRDEWTRDREEAGDERVPEEDAGSGSVVGNEHLAKEGELPLARAGSGELEVAVEDDDQRTEDQRTLHHAEQPAENLVDDLVSGEDRDLLVERLDDEGERQDGRDEHGTEPDHGRVRPRELRPVCRQVVPERLSKVRREQEREQDGRDAEQAPDRPLDEPEDEHREQDQHDEQVERVHGAEKFGDFHVLPALIPRGTSTRHRATPPRRAEGIAPQRVRNPGRRSRRWLGVSERSGGVRSGPETRSELGRQGARDPFGRSIDLAFGQRPVCGLERQPVGKAFLVGAERRAAIDVEQRDG